MELPKDLATPFLPERTTMHQDLHGWPDLQATPELPCALPPSLHKWPETTRLHSRKLS